MSYEENRSHVARIVEAQARGGLLWHVEVVEDSEEIAYVFEVQSDGLLIIHEVDTDEPEAEAQQVCSISIHSREAVAALRRALDRYDDAWNRDAARGLAVQGPTGDERAKGAKAITISPDAPALLAQRLVSRLRRDRVIPHALENYEWDALTESLADEIRQATVDGTLWRSA